MKDSLLQHVFEGLVYLLHQLMGNSQCLQWAHYCHSLANLLKMDGDVSFSVKMFAF